ncbi:nucleotide-diphospho-sugar transferase [Umbelopsis sp. PMI_123]|nr:nucleotide-diphospho-sugar transferase [Umbelopsis sp. PMI_123]
MIEDNFINPTDRTLLIAVVNHGMLEYTLNWIESLRRTEITEYLVFAIDQALVDAMTELGLGSHVVLIPEEWRHVQLSGDFAKWKTNSYTPITHAKSLIVERLLYLDVTVWFSDVDIVFINPSIYDHLMWNLKSRKDVHMVFSQETQHTTINSGFYLMRPTDVSKRVMGRTIDIQDRIPKLTQQRVMNRVLTGMDQHYKTSPMMLLDLMLFPNGHFYFAAKLPTSIGFEPMMVHANYRVGDAKKTSLQEVGLWYLDN